MAEEYPQLKIHPIYSTHGHKNKTHLGVNGPSLCGVEKRHPQLLYCRGEDYADVRGDFITGDADDVGCKACKKKALKLLETDK